MKDFKKENKEKEKKKQLFGFVDVTLIVQGAIGDQYPAVTSAQTGLIWTEMEEIAQMDELSITSISQSIRKVVRKSADWSD